MPAVKKKKPKITLPASQVVSKLRPEYRQAQTLLHCSQCSDEGMGRIAQGAIVMPIGWIWVWSFCSWGTGITWSMCCMNCVAHYPADQQGEPTCDQIVEAMMKVGPQARWVPGKDS